MTPIFILNQKVFNDESMAVSMSSILDISEVPGYCIHAIWTGTPTGTLEVRASNDGKNFNSTAVTSQAISGAAGEYLLNISSAHYKYVKISYTAASGAGNLTCYISGKQI